jgi:hypothetical protein
VASAVSAEFHERKDALRKSHPMLTSQAPTTNELNENVFDPLKYGKVDDEEMPAYSEVIGWLVFGKNSEHLSNCDQNTNDEIGSLGIDSHAEPVTGREGGS